MGFLSPYLLACAAVLAIPLWLHLRRKRRQTPVEFPSLRYLKMAAARMKRQARVEDVGLLLLRLLLVALLAAAFARPVIRSHGGWFGTGRSVESVVVIDATASMGWHGAADTRLDAAKRLAREWIEGLDRSDTVALWILTDKLEQPVPAPIADRGHWSRMLDAVTLSDGSSGLAPVFNAAREWTETRGIGRKELVIITDNQPAAWDWPAEGFFRRGWPHRGAGLVVLTPDAVRASNTCVATVEWDDRSAREGALLTGVARLVNSGDAAVNDVLECRIGGQTLLRKPVDLPAGGTLDVPISLPVPLLDGPVLTGELALAGDSLACDDHWYFALPLRRTLKALVVDRSGGMGGTMRPSFFLTRALAAGAAGKAAAIETDAWITQSTEGLDSVWFTGGAVADEATWSKALAYADAGGTVVVTGESQPTPLPKDWPVSAGEETNLPTGRIATRVLVPDHPLFDGVWSDQTAFPPMPQKSARQCEPAAGAKVFVTLAGGFPWLVERPHGKGRVIWLNASTDRSWGDLPLSPVFVPLVQQIARAKELARQTACACWVGEAWPELTKFAGDAAWPTAAGDANPATRTLRSGLFDAVSQDGKSQWRCAVNVRRAESDLRPVNTATLEAMLPGRVAAGTQGIRQWREEIRREVPIWPWLLAAAALVFLLEGWFASAAAKRRELTAGDSPPRALGPPFKLRMPGRRPGP